jgi:hypothetical protein
VLLPERAAVPASRDACVDPVSFSPRTPLPNGAGNTRAYGIRAIRVGRLLDKASPRIGVQQPNGHPRLTLPLFTVLTVVVSLYQAVRGFYFQWVQHKGGIVGPGSDVAEPWKFVVTRSIADALFYAVSTALGFVALLFDYRLLMSVPHVRDISAGAAAMVIFLTLFGLGGVTGQLPYQLQQGKFPKG